MKVLLRYSVLEGNQYRWLNWPSVLTEGLGSKSRGAFIF